jgi:ABC-type arginine transport system permease subunit
MSDKIHENLSKPFAPSGIYNTMGLDLVLFVFWCKSIVTNAPSDENLNLASDPVDEKPFSSGVCTVSVVKASDSPSSH